MIYLVFAHLHLLHVGIWQSADIMIRWFCREANSFPIKNFPTINLKFGELGSWTYPYVDPVVFYLVYVQLHTDQYNSLASTESVGPSSSDYDSRPQSFAGMELLPNEDKLHNHRPCRNRHGSKGRNHTKAVVQHIGDAVRWDFLNCQQLPTFSFDKVSLGSWRCHRCWNLSNYSPCSPC